MTDLEAVAAAMAATEGYALLPPAGDEPDVWHNGGWVCRSCGQPTETEPCEQHQPTAWAELEADSYDFHAGMHPVWVEGCGDCIERANQLEAQR